MNKLVSFIKSPSNKTTVLIVIIVVAIILAVLFRKKIRRTFERFDDSDGTVIVKYFYMEGCGYCKAFNPQWDVFQSQCASDPSQLVTPMKFEVRKDKDQIDSDVTGFPTVKVIKNGVTCVYTGERTAAALSDYIANFTGDSCPANF